MKDLNKTLIRSVELAKVLNHALEVKKSDNVKVCRSINELQTHATLIEEGLQRLCSEYAVEVNSAKLALWERKLLDLSLRNNMLNMRMGRNTISYEHPDIAALEDELADGKEIILEQKELKAQNR